MENVQKKVKKSGASLNARKARVGWLFILPFVIGFVLIYIPVIFESLSYSFATITMKGATQGGGYELVWCGFQNYINAINTTVDISTGETFLELVLTSLGSEVVDIIAILLLSLFVAVLLNSKMVGRGLFRAIFFIPVVVGAGIMTKINAESAEILATASGALEEIDTGAVGGGSMGNFINAMDIGVLFEQLGIATQLVETVSGIVTDIFNIVNRSGVQMLIFLSGLQSISPSVYESCQMEGASQWEIFWKITLPMISPMILVNAVYTVIDAFTSESNEVMAYIIGDSTLTPSASQSAMAWIYFAVVALAIVLVAAICSTFVFYQRRNDK